jgi:glycosyltransferase involved in cell wall biosynthesis
MNILFVHQSFPSQFKALAPALVQRGHNVVALLSRSLGCEYWEGVRLVEYQMGREVTPGIHPWIWDMEEKTIRGEACFRAALKLREEGFYPDVIIAHPAWGECLFLVEAWPKAKLGIHCEFHNPIHFCNSKFDPEFAWERENPDTLCRLRLRNMNSLFNLELADEAISPTHWQASRYPPEFRSKITIVHEGIDTQVLTPNDHVSLVLNDNHMLRKGDEIVTFVNRNLEPFRGFHTFMRALPDLLKRRPNARFLLVGGDGASYGSLPDKRRYGVSNWREAMINEVRPKINPDDWNRVHFMGHIPYDKFVSLLQISSVHVYLTYPYVLSWSLMEAMSAGCAVVVSNTQPLLEVVTHNVTGRMVDFFDYKALSEEVCSLLSDKEARIELGRAARKFIQSNYDLKTICLPAQVDWVEATVAHGERVFKSNPLQGGPNA